jgi:ABC-type phosphate transport system substrate-binding protein
MKRLIRIATFIAFSLPALLMAEDLVVVVNKSNPVDNLTKAQLKKIVLGEQGTWATGKKVSVVLRSPGQPERDGVLRSVCGMNEDDFNQYLMHANFSGDTGGAPKALSSGAAVRSLVMSIPGAIGFLHASDVNDTVKVVNVDGVAAGQPGYKIKEGK